MGKKNQRRKSVSKPTKSQNKKRKKKLVSSGLQFHHESIRNNWNPKETLRQNYKRLGLAYDVDECIKNAQAHKELKGAITQELTKVQKAPKAAKYIPKSMAVDEQRILITLKKKHGDDYKKMARDIKINIYQKTASELRQRMELFNHLQSL
mmetsp:Transcript_1063/g.1826  ORF Transcript_1063/g.1826 Transcript_1063/m.1826 type:complete len:151 (+) Transcript_1063:80-532(+)